MRYRDITPRILERAYWVYYQQGIVRNQTEFSQNILGRRPAYYSCMLTRHRSPSRQVMTQLRDMTKTIMGTWLGNAHFGQPYGENLNAAFEGFESLVGMLNTALDRMGPAEFSLEIPDRP